MLEPRVLYGEREEFDGDPKYRMPLGKAEIAREGKDVTVIAAGAMTRVALEALPRRPTPTSRSSTCCRCGRGTRTR